MNSNKEEAKKLEHELKREYQRLGVPVKGVSIIVEGEGVGYNPKRDKGDITEI